MPFVGPLKWKRMPHTPFRRHSRRRMSHTLFRTAQGERTPHTSFRRHSRPFGQAYAPSEVSGILSSKNNQVKGMTTFFFNSVQIKSMAVFFLIPKIYSSYGKIRLYARPKITHKTSWGGGGLIEN